ncbi:MAG: transposase [Candidatus Melainabacteria bacterium]|nr:transposase [Candidatus Melainabacteria bacterium]
MSLATSHAKRFFKGTYHHFCKTHIQKYLDEFCYRWNRRHREAAASHLITASLQEPSAPTRHASPLHSAHGCLLSLPALPKRCSHRPPRNHSDTHPTLRFLSVSFSQVCFDDEY